MKEKSSLFVLAKIYFLISFMFVISLNAREGQLPELESIEWQQVKLQERVQKQVESVINPIISKGKYLLRVEVLIDEPIPFMSSEGNDIQKNKKENQESKNLGIKATDAEFDKSQGDYIVFSKVGLEVPVVEEYLASDKNRRDHELEMIKRKEKSDEKYLENLYRFSQSFDLFSVLKDIKVNVFLDENLKEEKIELVKKVLQELKLKVGGIEPAITVKAIAMSKLKEPIKKKEVEEKKELTMEDYLTWASKFSSVIAMVVGAGLFGVVALLLLVLYFRFRNKETGAESSISMENNNSKEESKDNDESAAVAPFSNDGQEDQGSSDQAIKGIERFKRFYEANPMEALVLLKGWIGSEDENTIKGLTALSHELDNDSLKDIFSKLTKKEREEWKSKLKSSLPPRELADAKSFIGEQVVAGLIVPSVIKDPELATMLTGLTPEQGARFIEENPDQGKIFLNLITSQYSARIIDKIPEDIANTVLKESLGFNFEDIEKSLDDFKSKISKYNNKKEHTPFIDKIIEIIPEVLPERQEALLMTLIEGGGDDFVFDLTKKSFPDSLIKDLPKPFLKKLLQRYPVEDKVAMLLTIESNLKDNLLEVFAEKGSTARELIEMEFKHIEDSSTLKDKIEKEKSEHWIRFVNYVREEVRKDKDFENEVDEILQSYKSELLNRSGSNNNTVQEINQAA